MAIRMRVAVDATQHLDGHRQIRRDLVLAVPALPKESGRAGVAERMPDEPVILPEHLAHGEREAFLGSAALPCHSTR